MSGPLPTKTHVAQGLSRFTSRYKNATNLRAIWTAFGNQVQDFEDALWGVLMGRLLTWDTGVVIPYGDGTAGGITLTDAQGVNLDMLGTLLLEPRRGRSDGDYAQGLRLRVLADRSNGSPDSLLNIAQQSVLGTPTTISYLEEWPAGFVLTVIPPPAVQPLADLLEIAKPPGVAGALITGGSSAFVFDDLPAYAFALNGWSDTVDTYGTWCDVVELAV